MSVPLVLALGGGAPLEGQKLVRFVFTDEGGISRREPFVVVGGVIVHADDKLIPLENELEKLKRKHIPAEDRAGFIFHATDIWSGSGVFKDRDKWPLQRRLPILRDLARIPRKLDIPIVFEAIERANFDISEESNRNIGRDPTPSEESISAHAIVFMACTVRIEQVMRMRWPKEVAQIVAEDNDQIRQLVKGAHEGFRDPSTVPGLKPHPILPLRKIRGSVHFASKRESAPLQLADVCTFIIRGHLAKHPQNEPLFRLIKSMMLVLPAADFYKGPKITVEPPYVSEVIFGPIEMGPGQSS